MVDRIEHIHEGGGDSSGMGFFLGILLLTIFVVILLFYGLPLIRGGTGAGSPQINVPGKINVNIQKKQ